MALPVLRGGLGLVARRPEVPAHAWGGERPAWRAARYERKLRVPEQGLAEIEPRLRLHPAAFSEIHHARQVNNVYLDSPGLRCFHDNVSGNPMRFKVRIRWYGPAEAPVEAAQLEIKRKRGYVGIKDRFELGAIELERDLRPERLQPRLEAAGVPAPLRLGIAALGPVLFNSYRRRYYHSVDGDFRATIDERMRFRQLLRPELRGRELEIPGAVLELKYPMADESRLPDLVGDLPYRVTRNSKYVTGIRATWR